MRLSAAAIGHLARLGAVVHAAPGPTEHAEAVAVVLLACRRHRRDGVTWADLAVAVGIPEPEVRAWALADTPKGAPRPHPVRPAQVAIEPISTATATETFSINTIQHASITQSQSIQANATDRANPITTAHHRRVLAVSGHPRHAAHDNVFGLEIAAIRTALPGVDVRELTCPDLAELCRYLDELRPSVLHIAAHNQFGGLHLTLDGQPSAVDDAALEEALRAMTMPPKAIVLAACKSTTFGARLAVGHTTALSWPGLVTDEQARLFAALFYRELGAGISIGAANRYAGNAVSTRFAELVPPEVHGDSTRIPL